MLITPNNHNNNKQHDGWDDKNKNEFMFRTEEYVNSQYLKLKETLLH